MKKFAIMMLSVILVFALVGCKSSDYKQAVELQDSGNYPAAMEMFALLGDYKDSAQRLASCQAEQDKIDNYAKANKLLADRDFQAAAAVYEKLGNFEESAKNLAFCEDMISAMNSFDSAVSALGEKNDGLEAAVSQAEAILLEQAPVLNEDLYPVLEASIEAAKGAQAEAAEMPENADEIRAAADEMNSVDYSAVIGAMEEAQADLAESRRLFAFVDNPSEEHIIACLEKVDGITGISAVTEKNDPNGRLNKAGGYTAQVYFSHANINQRYVSGGTIIAKGVHCGGCVEVYPNAQLAKTRADYLARFDGTVFTTGTHKQIGTCVIRTSEKLSEEDQQALEDAIIAQLFAE